MRTIRTKIYNFTELSEEAQQYAITKYYDINTDYNWWDNVSEEAEKLVREEDFYDYFYDREKQFLKDILNCYFKMLKQDLEYRESEEAIVETLSNAYEFLSNGTLYS